jgi:Transglycosylase-like domain
VAAAPPPTAPPTAGTPATPPSSAAGQSSTPTPTPTPSPPPPNYVPKTGTHPHHDDPFLTCTRQRESGGNYQAYNPAGPFYGAYQFLQSTWNGAANHAGRGDLVGIDPRTASAYDQDDLAWSLYQWRGKGPWNGFC